MVTGLVLLSVLWIGYSLVRAIYFSDVVQSRQAVQNVSRKR